MADIAGRQLACGVPADKSFLLVDLADDGLLISAVEPDAGDIVDQRVLWAIHPTALDQALSEHLVRVGRVDAPTTDSWWNELRELAARGREKLAATDGTFVMGHGNVQFFRVAQRDLDTATAPAAAELTRALREMGKEFQSTSVYLGYDNEDWPGLDKVLERNLHLPVVVSQAPADHPGLVAADTLDPGTPATDTGATAAGPAMTQPTTAAAPAASATRRPGWRPGRRLLIAMAAIAAVIIGVGTATALAMSGGDDTPSTPTAGLFSSSSTSSSAPAAPPASAAPPAATSPPAPPAPTTFADPAALAAAQVPAVRYTPPPPPPEPTQDTTTGGGSQQGPYSPNRPRPAPAPPRGRAIPNPIPGLPPIVIPRLPGGPG